MPTFTATFYKHCRISFIRVIRFRASSVNIIWGRCCRFPVWTCERLQRSAPQNSSLQNAVKALDLHDLFFSPFCHCRRERNTHLNSFVIVYMEENHIKPLHAPRYNHALNKITARLPGPILRWVEASALTRVVMPCSASLCPLDRCAVIHTFPVKPEPHHVLWAIFNAAAVTSARPIPQRLGQIWGTCGWVGVRRCLEIVGVIKLHFQAGKDGSISVDNKSSLALFGLISLLNHFPRLRLSPFFSLALSHPLAPTQWNTSRRCQPSLKVRVPLGVLFRGTLPPPRLRGLLSLYPQRWKSPAASLWRCARCHGNSVLQTQKTGSRDVQTFWLFTFEHRVSVDSFPSELLIWRPHERCFVSLLSSSLSSCQVLWGDFSNQKELRLPASQRPSHGSVLVQRHSEQHR